MKKQVVIFFFLLSVVMSIFGQTSHYISYNYDVAGNRILRKSLEVTLRSANAPIDTSGVASDLNDLKVTIYPNPTKGTIVIGLSSFSPGRKVKLSVFSADGKSLKRMAAQSDRTIMDLSVYSSGMYLLLVTEGEKSIECKIVKQ